MLPALTAVVAPILVTLETPLGDNPCSKSVQDNIRALQRLCKDFDVADLSDHNALLKLADKVLKDTTEWLSHNPKDGAKSPACRRVQDAQNAAKSLKAMLPKLTEQQKKEMNAEVHNDALAEQALDTFDKAKKSGEALLKASTDDIGRRRAEIGKLQAAIRDKQREFKGRRLPYAKNEESLVRLLRVLRDLHAGLTADYRKFFLSPEFTKTFAPLPPGIANRSDVRPVQGARQGEIKSLQDKIVALHNEVKEWLVAAEKVT